MRLPIARDGPPFRSNAIAAGSFVASNWVWILSFTLFGFTTDACYRALRGRETTRPAASTNPQQQAA